jgi:hypothetical protein
VLAIQLLNNTANSQDIFILPELWANELEPGSIAHPKHLSVLSIERRKDGFPSTMTVGVAQGRIYQLQSSSDMEHWSNRGNQVLARGAAISFPITGTFFFAPRFYRVVELGD